MRAGDKDTTNTENPRNTHDSHGHLPIGQEGLEPIEQLAEKEQEGHFNGEDGDPAHDFHREGQLLVVKNTVHKTRGRGLLQHEFARAKDQAHVEVNILEHDVDESEGSDQRRAAEQQDVVIDEKTVLVTEPDGKPADGR